MREPSNVKTIKPTDLRGILKYVPQFRDHIFVIAIDGSIVDDENFANVVTDIAVLRSLNIKVVLVHGVGRQLKRAAERQGISVSDVYGEGRTDKPTLDLAIEVSGLVSQQIMEQMTLNGLKCAVTNAVRSTVVGIVRGVDQGHTGKIEKIDLPLFKSLLDMEVVPLVTPICFNREGHPLRVNSDLLASELAVRLQASKLIYLTPHPGLLLTGGEAALNIPLDELEALLDRNIDRIDERLRSKAMHAARTLEAGTPRAHILDGRVFGALLTEIFEKVGLGTMIHANDYQQIRQAKKKDAQAIFNITKNAVKSEALKQRTRQIIERDIDNYFVYEIDESIIGCASLTPFPGTKMAELAAVYVQPFYQGKGVGKKLVDYAMLEAARRGIKTVLALSTQTYSFFRDVCGFQDADVDMLPAARRQEYESSGRHSRVLYKPVKKPAAPKRRVTRTPKA